MTDTVLVRDIVLVRDTVLVTDTVSVTDTVQSRCQISNLSQQLSNVDPSHDMIRIQMEHEQLSTLLAGIPIHTSYKYKYITTQINIKILPKIHPQGCMS